MWEGVAHDFADFQGRIWLNAASEGPLPNTAKRALEEAVEWKRTPYLLDHARFAQIPLGLKTAVSRLLQVPARDVILGNSASYGIHLLANGLPWNSGDEILLMQNDFPTDILPWLALQQQGVRVRQIASAGRVLQPDELEAAITSHTKVFCVSQVHTFSGIGLDVAAMASICREKGVRFVLNVSQSAGTIPLDIPALGVDAVVCAGYKWLLGPYGTGFAWIDPAWRESLIYNQAYWISSLSEEDLRREDALELKDMRSARKYDVFGTANFFNFVPFCASIEYLLEKGMDHVHARQQELVQHFIDRLPDGYELISPARGPLRSSLVVFSAKTPAANPGIFEQLNHAGIHTALWKGNIRVSPHIYNTFDEITQLCEALGKRKD